MRNAFIEELVEQATTHDNIALIVGDLGYSVVEPFANQFPDRFFNAGVAEQNMTGLAAGLASEGYHVFTYSIANFSTFRCAEQIRNDVDYHNLAVTVVSIGGGLAYGALGYSHHAVQDYSLIRCMPNMLIASPGDSQEVKACIRFLIDNPQPSYLRLGKTSNLQFHKDIPKLSPGKWLSIVNNKEITDTILSTGGALEIAINWRNKSTDFLNWNIHSMPLWGMKEKPLQPTQVENFSNVLTIEDHLQDGGFGSWMMESLIGRKELIDRLNTKALDPSICKLTGSQNTLNTLGGLRLFD